MMFKAYMNVIFCLFRAVSLTVCVCEFVCVYQYGRERDRSRMGGTNYQFNLIYFSLLVLFFFVNEEEKINKKVVSSQYSSQNKTKKWRPIVGGYFHLFFSASL